MVHWKHFTMSVMLLGLNIFYSDAKDHVLLNLVFIHDLLPSSYKLICCLLSHLFRALTKLFCYLFNCYLFLCNKADAIVKNSDWNCRFQMLNIVVVKLYVSWFGYNTKYGGFTMFARLSLESLYFCSSMLIEVKGDVSFM